MFLIALMFVYRRYKCRKVYTSSSDPGNIEPFRPAPHQLQVRYNNTPKVLPSYSGSGYGEKAAYRDERALIVQSRGSRTSSGHDEDEVSSTETA